MLQPDPSVCPSEPHRVQHRDLAQRSQPPAGLPASPGEQPRARGVTQGLERGLCRQGKAPVTPNSDLHGGTAAFLLCATGTRTGRVDPKCLAKGSESLAQQGRENFFCLIPCPEESGLGSWERRHMPFPAEQLKQPKISHCAQLDPKGTRQTGLR